MWKHGRRIICIASVVGVTGNPGQANYAAAAIYLAGAEAAYVTGQTLHVNGGMAMV